MRTITRNIILCVLAFTTLLTFLIGIFGIDVPTRYQYNSLFGEHVKMATYNLATFEGIEREVKTIKELTIEEFPINRDKVYYSPFYWDFIYSSSVAGNIDYLDSILARISDYKTMQDNMVANLDGVQFRDWYDQAIQDLRAEMSIKNSDSESPPSRLDYVIFNAWVLKHHPEAYWSLVYLIPIILIQSAVLMPIIACTDTRKSDEEYQSRSQN